MSVPPPIISVKKKNKSTPSTAETPANASANTNGEANTNGAVNMEVSSSSASAESSDTEEGTIIIDGQRRSLRKRKQLINLKKDSSDSDKDEMETSETNSESDDDIVSSYIPPGKAGIELKRNLRYFPKKPVLITTALDLTKAREIDKNHYLIDALDSRKTTEKWITLLNKVQQSWEEDSKFQSLLKLVFGRLYLKINKNPDDWNLTQDALFFQMVKKEKWEHIQLVFKLLLQHAKEQRKFKKMTLKELHTFALYALLDSPLKPSQLKEFIEKIKADLNQPLHPWFYHPSLKNKIKDEKIKISPILFLIFNKFGHQSLPLTITELFKFEISLDETLFTQLLKEDIKYAVHKRDGGFTIDGAYHSNDQDHNSKDASYQIQEYACKIFSILLSHKAIEPLKQKLLKAAITHYANPFTYDYLKKSLNCSINLEGMDHYEKACFYAWEGNFKAYKELIESLKKEDKDYLLKWPKEKNPLKIIIDNIVLSSNSFLLISFIAKEQKVFMGDNADLFTQFAKRLLPDIDTGFLYYFVQNPNALIKLEVMNAILNFYNESKGFDLSHYDKLLGPYATWIASSVYTSAISPNLNCLKTFWLNIFVKLSSDMHFDFEKISNYLLENILTLAEDTYIESNFFYKHLIISHKLNYFVSIGYNYNYFLDYLINNAQGEKPKIRTTMIFRVFTATDNVSFHPALFNKSMHRLCALIPQYDPEQQWNVRADVFTPFHYCFKLNFGIRDEQGKTLLITRLLTFKDYFLLIKDIKIRKEIIKTEMEFFRFLLSILDPAETIEYRVSPPEKNASGSSSTSPVWRKESAFDIINDMAYPAEIFQAHRQYLFDSSSPYTQYLKTCQTNGRVIHDRLALPVIPPIPQMIREQGKVAAERALVFSAKVGQPLNQHVQHTPVQVWKFADPIFNKTFGQLIILSNGTFYIKEDWLRLFKYFYDGSFALLKEKYLQKDSLKSNELNANKDAMELDSRESLESRSLQSKEIKESREAKESKEARELSQKLQQVKLEQLAIALKQIHFIKTRNSANELIFDTDDFQAYRYYCTLHRTDIAQDGIPDYLKRMITTLYSLLLSLAKAHYHSVYDDCMMFMKIQFSKIQQKFEKQFGSKDHITAMNVLILELAKKITRASSAISTFLPSISMYDRYASVSIAANRVFQALDPTHQKTLAHFFSLRNPRLLTLFSMNETSRFKDIMPEILPVLNPFIEKVRKYYFEEYENVKISALCLSQLISKESFESVFNETLPFLCYSLPDILKYNQMQHMYLLIHDLSSLKQAFIKFNPPEISKETIEMNSVVAMDTRPSP